MTAPIADEQLAAWSKGLGAKAWGVQDMEGDTGYEITDDDDLVAALCWHREIAAAIAALPELVAEAVRLRREIAEEQDIAERCQAICGECKGLCGPESDEEGD